MATVILMPKQGNTVESCIIVDWKRKVGDQIAAGDTLCEVETDKATLDVESTTSGKVLALYFEQGDDVPVLTPIAAVGQPGDDIANLAPDIAGTDRREMNDRPAVMGESQTIPGAAILATQAPDPAKVSEGTGISPRAKNLALKKGVAIGAVQGTGPGGRIIERDILAALAAQPRLTPVAKRMSDRGGFVVPVQGSGAGGRVTSADLIPGTGAVKLPAEPTAVPDEVQEIQVQGVRRLIAERMLHSLSTTAQLTLNSSADARGLLAYRKRLKQSDETLGLRDVTIGDLLLFVVARTLTRYPDLNAHFTGDTVLQYKQIHLASAVDTPRGLMVPVIRHADTLSLKQISLQAKRLAAACQEGNIAPDDLTGGTFTVTNLGAFGIQTFTPILNPPQVGILGVGNINLKPVSVDGEVQFIPHIGLSLTINHQVVDGAPGARFLQALSQNLADLELILAL